jgi:anti-sigma28 factor (negative regulator of flagellin synthesis)
MSGTSPVSAADRVRVSDAGLFARHQQETQVPSVRRGNDEVEVSAVATYLSKLRQLPIRQDLVDRVREEIAQGTYDTSDRLDAALDELIQDL